MSGVKLPPNLNVYITVALFILGAYLFALYAGLIVWTIRDIRSRSRDVLAHILATLLVAVFTFPGWLVYLLVRPHTTLAEEYDRSLVEEAMLQDLEERHVCPGCRRRVEADFLLCPYCHRELRARCTSCGRLLNLNWDVCPYCGLTRPKLKKHEREKALTSRGTPPSPVLEPAPQAAQTETTMPIAEPEQIQASTAPSPAEEASLPNEG